MAVTARLVVVGGGALGTFHALEGVRRGYDVVQVERDAGPRGASVRNFGFLWMTGRAAGADLELCLRGRDGWERVAREAPGVGFRTPGALVVAANEAERDVLEELAGAADAALRGVRMLARRDLRRLLPAATSAVAALRGDRDASVEPAPAIAALHSLLAGSGRHRLLVGRTVVEVGDGSARDHTGELHRGDVVIVCSGDAPQLWPADVAAAVRRCRLQMLVTAPRRGPLPAALTDGGALRYYPAFAALPSAAALPEPDALTARERLQLLVVQRNDGSLTIGDTHVYDEPFPVGLDERPTRALLGRARALLGSVPRVARRWGGTYAERRDGGLVLRSALDATTTLVTAAGGRGMTCSPAIAEDTFAGLGL
jgi:FAD dependent oxidoreductase TIGR03364